MQADAIAPLAPVIAFSELEKELKNTKEVELNEAGLPPKAPLFVTWTKHGNLRGCIGTFSELPTPEGIREYAIVAALRDPRFPPIKPSEIPQLEVSVTLLGPLERIEDPLDFEIGKHGVKATFPGGRSATYLPEVAEEQGWTKEETLEMLAEKAGARSIAGIKMWRYAGVKTTMSYKDYLKAKESGNLG